MKVRCINDKPHGSALASGYKALVEGQIYEVERDEGHKYKLVGVQRTWAKSRFKEVEVTDILIIPTDTSITIKPTNSDLDFFARPADPTHCKCGIPQKQCGYHS